MSPQPPPSGSGHRLHLRIAPKAESKLRAGHPWLYADSIRAQNRPGTLGELAVIFDRKDCFLAVGLFDPHSPLRVRVLHRGKPRPIDESWWRERLREPAQRRAGIFDSQTTGYRCIHGESDGWPGLVLDRYGNTLVLKLYTAAWLPRLPKLITLFTEEFAPQRLVLRLSRNIQPVASGQFQLHDGGILLGPQLAEPVVFLESGLHFEADPLRGQKTGFFLDQRENRRRVESLAADRSVLNLFSFSGGFSLYAARAGARSVADVDMSPHALASAERNFALNRTNLKVALCPHESIQADVFAWLEKSSPRKFDLIILDPPSLAKREAERSGAINAYQSLVRDALPYLNREGLLVAASCSAHVSATEFFSAVLETARRSGVKLSQFATTLHPPDHPATFPEAEYLKCIYLRREL